ncbi:MAG: hypothetical protein IPK50_22635 [Fibrobacterota bacterium]|nr:MAG: hypothetical protein IPK50_22635 [Fibrobacterota bacterium]
MDSPTTRATASPGRQAAWILTALGVAHIPLVGFHFFIPSQFAWKTQLPRLSEDNSSLMWGLLLCGIFWLGSMGIATLIEGIRRLRSGEGCFPRSLWLWMAAFWIYRIAIQIPFCHWTLEDSAFLMVLALFPSLYVIAWWKLKPGTFDPTFPVKTRPTARPA